jgi:hypothetical protein
MCGNIAMSNSLVNKSILMQCEKKTKKGLRTEALEAIAIDAAFIELP